MTHRLQPKDLATLLQLKPLNMKTLLFCLALLWQLRAFADETTLTVAVLDFESKEDAIRDVGAKFSSVVAAHLGGSPKIVLVERAELANLLSEQEHGLSGSISSDSAARIGHLTGAKALITGKIMRVDKDYLVIAKVMGSETGRIFAETIKGSASEAYTTLAENLSGKLLAVIEKHADALVASVLEAKDYQKILNDKLSNKPRPKISIHLPEQHFGAVVNDPAAETEISLLLQKTGFTLVDSAHASEADIQIVGEAFSAYGTRKGNLISCKARVEVKATNRRGQVLHVDRETSVAIDISEQTAAKSALQKAASEISLRLLPALVNRQEE